MKYYHYTVMDRLQKIVNDGYLKLTPDKKDLMKNEGGFVWLTIKPEWDLTAFLLTDKKTLDDAGRIRITLEGWFPSHRKYINKLPHIKGLESQALKVGIDPNNWAVSNKRISVKKFTEIHIWVNNSWVNFEDLD